MKANVGGIDKILRIVAGVVLLALIFVLNKDGLWLWGMIGIVPLATGVAGWCPLYPMLGINSCPSKR